MRSLILLVFEFLLFNSYQFHPVGPPEEEGLVSPYQYYYDILINETTIALPNFNEITGIQFLSISGNLQLTERELAAFFDKIDIFVYGIRVNNTNLKTLSFLKPFIVHEDDDGLNSSIAITNNKELTSIGIDFEHCSWCDSKIIITNNPKLDLESECDEIIARYGSKRVITDNLVDCGCTIKGQFNKWVETIPSSCYWLFGNVVIDASSDLKLLQSKMANVTRITGGLKIANTTLTDLSLFESLEKVENAKKSETQTSLTIAGNQQLTSLKIMPIRDGVSLTILDNPKLCILPQELETLYGGESLGSNLEINVCFDANSPKHWCSLEAAGDFRNLSETCEILVGDLVLNEQTFDYPNLYHLYEITKIYGSLSIIGTAARNTFMFPSLREIVSIKPNKTPLEITNNTNLIEIFENFGYMMKLESQLPVVVQNNKNLMVRSYQCSAFITSKNPIVDNNLFNCDFNDKTPSPEKSNINVDIFQGIPKYIEVSHSDSSPDDGGTQNLPGLSNSTDGIGEEPSTTVAPSGRAGLRKPIYVCILSVLIHKLS